MAALGKIRSHGAILVGVIGAALLAFIAEEAFRSCDSHKNESRQQIGEVLGEKVSMQEYQKLVDEFTNVLKITQGRDNLTDDELNQVKDQVWQTYVQNRIIEEEAKKLGLTVTDKELPERSRRRYKPNAFADSFREPADRTLRRQHAEEVLDRIQVGKDHKSSDG